MLRWYEWNTEQLYLFHEVLIETLSSKEHQRIEALTISSQAVFPRLKLEANCYTNYLNCRWKAKCRKFHYKSQHSITDISPYYSIWVHLWDCVILRRYLPPVLGQSATFRFNYYHSHRPINRAAAGSHIFGPNCAIQIETTARATNGNA